MQLIIFGAPGAGKGTLAQNIKKYKNHKHISTGDLFRKHIKNQTELGKIASSYIDAGELVPDEVTDDLIYSELELIKKDFILDGYPRNIHQAQRLDEILEELEIPLTACVYLSIDKNVIVDRLLYRVVCQNCGFTYNLKIAPTKVEGICDNCGGELSHRKDDSSDVIIHRIETYEKETAPVINFYEEKNSLVSIDCSKYDLIDNFEDVWQTLLKKEVEG